MSKEINEVMELYTRQYVGWTVLKRGLSHTDIPMKLKISNMLLAGLKLFSSVIYRSTFSYFVYLSVLESSTSM